MEIPIEIIEKYSESEKKFAKVYFDEKYFSRFSVSIPNPILFDKRVSSTAVRVYGLLQIFAMWKDHCYPGHKRLAEFLKVAESTIRRALKNLEETNWIKIKRRGQGKTNIYTITWPKDCYSPDKAVAQKQYKKDKAETKRRSEFGV